MDEQKQTAAANTETWLAENKIISNVQLLTSSYSKGQRDSGKCIHFQSAREILENAWTY